MSAAPRIIGLFPHPDDEAYAVGGTLARCVQAGAEVVVVTATEGEAGNDRRSGEGPGPGLGRVRMAELQRACAALGVGAPIGLGLPDGGLSDVDVEAVVASLLPRLDALSPAALITLGHDGVYANLDHISWTHIVADLHARLARPARLFHAAFPQGLFRALYRALSRRRGPRLTARLPVDALGIERQQADIVVPIDAVRHRKLAAIAAHASQLRHGDPLSFLMPGLVSALLDEEWLTLAAGPPLNVAIDDPVERIWA